MKKISVTVHIMHASGCVLRCSCICQSSASLELEIRLTVVMWNSLRFLVLSPDLSNWSLIVPHRFDIDDLVGDAG